MKTYSISNLSKLQLKRLRQDIIMNSLFLRDYQNRYGISSKEVCYFFEGYLDNLVEISKENNDNFETLNEIIHKYDTIDNLYDYYCSVEWVL